MSNWKHEELKYLEGLGRQVVNAPRAEGQCQACYSKRNDGFIVLNCLECGFGVGSFDADEAIRTWNRHIIYR